MAYIYDLTDTWNAGGTTFNAIKMNVTDTASAVSSKLVTLQTSGTEHFSVTKAGVGYFSGNLGIGITSPTAKLNVSGGAVMSRFQTGSAVDGRIEFAYNVTDIGYLNMASATQLELYGRTGVALAFGAGNAERMRITAAGNVGIGLTPAHLFSVKAATDGVNSLIAGATKAVRINHTPTETRLEGVSQDGTTFQPLQIGGSFVTVSESGTEVARFTGGKLGIGTTTPAEKFQVIGSIRVNTTSTIFSNNYSAGNTQTWLTNNASSSDTYIVADRAQRYRMLTGIGHQWETAETGLAGASITYTERMRLDTGGNVGIGTTTVGSRLTIGDNGTGQSFTNAAGGNLNIGLLAGTGSADAYVFQRANAPLIIGTNNAERMRIDASGNLGLGITAFGTSAAKVIGMANATAPTTSPAGMGQLYVEGGALKFRGSSGTVTTIAPA